MRADSLWIGALWKPRFADRYREEVSSLIRLFHEEKNRKQTTGLIRGLIEKIVLAPDPKSDGLLVTLHGDLAGILNLAGGEKDIHTEDELRPIRLVAGLDSLRHMEKAHAKARRTGTASSTPIHRANGGGSKLVGPAGLEPATRSL